MADDIDALLDEVEDSLSRGAKGTASSPTSDTRMKDIKSESVKTDDLKDLLEDLEEPPVPLSRAIHTSISLPPGSSGRCSIPHLGGTSFPTGLSTGVTLRACDCLRCLKCDMSVVAMNGFSWSSKVDYLFLRNNYPDLSRLSARLEPQHSARAYACQCQHRSITESTTVADIGGLKWVCGGHSQGGK